MRLGEILLGEGLVSEADLTAALRTQSALGGRLGTNLIELGFVDPDDVANALAVQKGVPAARLKFFQSVDSALLRAVPRYLAERVNAIPLAVATRFGKELVVAFQDPDDISAVEQVKAAARISVRPAVAPEFYVIHYLERLYGIPPRRFLRSAPVRAIRDRQNLQTGPTSGYPRSAGSGPHVRPLGHEEISNLTIDPKKPGFDDIDSGWDDDFEAGPPPAPALTPAPAAPAASVAPVPAAPAAPVAVPEQPSDAAPAVVAQAAPKIDAVDALDRIERAETRDEVGDALVDYLRSNLGHALVLICKKDAALGWKGYSPGVDQQTIESVSVPLTVPSMFHQPYHGGIGFKGPPPPHGADIQNRLWALMRCSAPKEVLVVPIKIGSRVINLCYGHTDDAAIATEAMADLRALCDAATQTFVRLIKAAKAG